MLCQRARIQVSQGAKDRAREYSIRTTTIARDYDDEKLEEAIKELQNSLS